MAKHILSCSFGKDSIATALLALQHGEPLDELVYCEVMFSEEISGELPEHNRFIHETAIPYFEQRGIPTRVLRSEKTYLSCFYHVVTRGKTKGMLSGFPLSGRCTIQRDCKLPPIKAYQKALPPDTVQYIGIAADEPKRLARLKPGQISLLDKYHVAEPEARSMCAAEELLSPLYDFTKRGGCWFCPNASISELRHLYRYHPELWQLLLELQDVPNKPTEHFSWRRTFREIDERFRQEGEQLRQYRTTATIRIAGRPFCKNPLGRPCFCSQERTDSSCQTGSVSQNQICQRKHDIEFGLLLFKPSVSCFSETQLLFNNTEYMLYFCSD